MKPTIFEQTPVEWEKIDFILKISSPSKTNMNNILLSATSDL